MKSSSGQKGMKRFFLYHAEKLILGTSLALMGVFFWLGYRDQPYRDKTPSDLVRLANEADQYIGSQENWDKIRELPARQPEEGLVDRISTGNQTVSSDKYVFGPWSIRVKTLAQRKDPVLLSPQNMVASHFVAPMIISPRNVSSNAAINDRLASFPMATDSEAPRGGAAAGGGLGGEGGRSGGLGEGAGTSMDGGSSMDGDGGGRGGASGTGRSGSGADRDRGKEPPVDAGTKVLVIHEKTLPGVRPIFWNLSNSSEEVMVADVVAITGLVDFEQQNSGYLENFLDAVGYYPKRDRPTYKYLEVQRARVVEGQEPQWEDISGQVEVYHKAIPNALKRISSAEYPTAPEFIEEGVYDPVLTRAIPAFTQFDYRKFLGHTNVDTRKFDPLPKKKEEKTLFDITSATTSPEEVETTQVPLRMGSDSSRFEKMLTGKDNKSRYRLVRFFDISRADSKDAKKPGEVYQYRVRAWASDPNSQPESTSSVSGGGGGTGGPTGGRAAGGGSRGGMSSGGVGADAGGGSATSSSGGSSTANESGRGGSARGGSGSGSETGGDENDEDRYKEVPITPQMTHPDVRSRLAAAKEEPDAKDKKKIRYFVKEAGYDDLIQVPEGKDELRFCRPTPWSETVTIEIKSQPMGDIIAGKIETPKPIQIGTAEIPEGEAVANLVVAPWSTTLNAQLPALKKAYRGEALDFSATIHALNPLSWAVHRVKNAPVLSRSVFVDMMGGKEVEPRYHVASEMLVLNPDGSFRITNDLDDRTQYKQKLLEPDDSNEIGTAKVRPDTDNRSGGRPGGNPSRGGGGR